MKYIRIGAITYAIIIVFLIAILRALPSFRICLNVLFMTIAITDFMSKKRYKQIKEMSENKLAFSVFIFGIILCIGFLVAALYFGPVADLSIWLFIFVLYINSGKMYKCILRKMENRAEKT